MERADATNTVDHDDVTRTDTRPWWPDPSRVVALWALCTLLRRVLHQSLGASGVPKLNAATWSEVAALAQEHLLEGTLFAAIQSLPTHAVPQAELVAYLSNAHRANLFKNVRMKHDLLALLAGFNEVGIEPVIVKGGAVLLAGAPQSLQVRGMHDLDVLVPSGEFPSAQAAMVAMGYRAVDEVDRPRHAVEYSSPDRLGGVDLHSELGVLALRRVLSTNDAIAGSTARSINGLNYRALNHTHSIIHNIAHAQLHDFNHAVAGTPVRQLYTYAALIGAFGSDVDWDEVTARFDAGGQGRVVGDHAEMARRLLDVVTPVPSPRRSHAHYARCMASFAMPALCDVPRNLAYAFGSDYLRERYGVGSVTALRLRHARQLWSDRDNSLYEQSMVRRTA